MLKQKKGFTFLELAIVISIIAILFVVAFPNYRVSRDSTKTYSQAKEVETDLRQMRQLAISQRKDVKIDFVSTVALYIDRYDVSFVDSDQRDIKNVNILPGVNIEVTPTAFRFNRDGALRDEDGFILTKASIRIFLGGDQVAFEIKEDGLIEEI